VKAVAGTWSRAGRGRGRATAMRPVALTVLLLARVAGALEPAQGEAAFRAGWMEARIGTAKPAALRGEPEYHGGEPLYMELPLGNGTNAPVIGVIDGGVGIAGRIHGIHLDVNGNNSLLDDPVFHARLERGSFPHMDPVDIQVSYADGTKRLVSVKLEFRRQHRRDTGRAFWSVACHVCQHMAGRIPLGSKNVLVGIYDSSGEKGRANGCFNDYCCDRLRIDFNGDSKLDRTTEELPLSRFLSLDGKIWLEVHADPGARNVRFKRCNPSLGELDIRCDWPGSSTMSGGRIELLSDDGYGFVLDMGHESVLSLPESDYRVTRAKAFLRDEDKRLWKCAFSLGGPLKVRKGGVATLRLGGALKFRPTVNKWPRPGTGLCLFPGVTGAGGERYRNISPAQTRMQPHVTISDVEGVVVSQGPMEYG